MGKKEVIDDLVDGVGPLSTAGFEEFVRLIDYNLPRIQADERARERFRRMLNTWDTELIRARRLIEDGDPRFATRRKKLLDGGGT